MKFLLVAVNAKYIHSNPAIYSLKAYVGERGSQVELAEYTINHMPEFILKDIYRRKPDVIGFSCYIWNISMVKRLIDDIHQVLPNTPIWLGGPEVSFDCASTLEQFPQIEGIMFGEGERIFSHLLDYYLTGSPKKEEIKGIAYRTNCSTIQVNAPEPIMDLTEVPFLYDDFQKWEHRIIYYETSRGCPFRCSYCLSSVDKQLRFRDLDVVKKELDIFLKQQVAQVKFVDRTFNAKKSHGLEIWNYLMEQDNGVTNFHFEVSADLIGEEELAVLRQMRPGLIQLEIGVQTTNPKTTEAICRHASFEQICNIVRIIHSFQNIHQHLDLIAGLPYEDYKSFGRSFNDVYALEPDQLQMGFLKVLKGSPMHKEASKYGICYSQYPPYEVLFTNWLSYEDVLRLKGIEEVLEVYYNSGQFSLMMPYLERKFDSAFAMYEALAEYYEKNGLFSVNHSRLARYEILKAFAMEIDETDEIAYNNLLTYDYNAREKAKKRPAFSKDLSIYWEEIKAFYQKEAKEHHWLSGYETYNSRQLEHITQLEVFDFDVLTWKAEKKLVFGETWVLFDYKNRDPLMNNATIIKIRSIQNGGNYGKAKGGTSCKNTGVDG